MKVAITGASGFLGTRLSQALTEAGHSVQPLGRSPQPGDLAAADAIVNLAGEPIAQRWTAEVKQRIYSSRVERTRNLVSALAKLPEPPRVLVNASAIGIYGSRGDEILTENSPRGADFLARVCIDWENAAQSAAPLGIRVVMLRFAVVLGKGGALAKMLLPFRLGIGGRLGSGTQWMSWIHINDAVDLILFALANEPVRGPLNTAAPNPVTNQEFTRRLAAILHRPAIFPVPPPALRLLFGEMADALLGSQRVMPVAAQSAYFRFRYPDLAPALADLLAK
jgi:uncharacterized protein (TIGR01777 family)